MYKRIEHELVSVGDDGFVRCFACVWESKADVKDRGVLAHMNSKKHKTNITI